MFTEFLLGILLMTSIVMIVLLVAPRPNDDVKASRLPWAGALLALLIVFLAVLGGFAMWA